MATTGCAGEEEVRSIAAGNEQDEADGGQEEQHQRAHPTEDLLVERFEECGHSFEEEACMQGFESLDDAAHLDLCVCQPDTRSKASERVNTEFSRSALC